VVEVAPVHAEVARGRREVPPARVDRLPNEVAPLVAHRLAKGDLAGFGRR